MEEREVVVGEEKESYSRWGESCRRRGETIKGEEKIVAKRVESSTNSRSFPKAYFILGHPVEGEEKVAGNKIFIGG